MTLNDLLPGEPWMDPEERQTAADLVRSLQESFAERQIPETPFLILRVQDYLLHHTLCRRLERNLTPNPAAETPAEILPKLAEQIGKCRDRLRRSLKELEDAAAKLAPPPPPPPPPARPFNLPDFYKPILEEVGVDLINDPDFFADEDNYYDIPLAERKNYQKPAPESDDACLLGGANPDNSPPSDPVSPPPAPTLHPRPPRTPRLPIPPTPHNKKGRSRMRGIQKRPCFNASKRRWS